MADAEEAGAEEDALAVAESTLPTLHLVDIDG